MITRKDIYETLMAAVKEKSTVIVLVGVVESNISMSITGTNLAEDNMFQEGSGRFVLYGSRGTASLRFHCNSVSHVETDTPGMCMVLIPHV